MTKDPNAIEDTPKREWVKPEVGLVEAGNAEAAPPGQGTDSVYNYS